MAYTADQIEKHTIVARLSVSIYRMNDEQLSTILNLLENEDESAAGTDAPPEDPDFESRALERSSANRR